MGIRNKLAVGVHMKELDNFKKFCALLTLQNRFNVSVNLSTAHKMNYSGIGGANFPHEYHLAKYKVNLIRTLTYFVTFCKRHFRGCML